MEETRHGVFLQIAGKGILIEAEPGTGKSEIALELISRGHQLIADDAVIFTKSDNTTITGSCSNLLQDLLEVRGLGILNIRSLYGDNAIMEKARLSLIISLIPADTITEKNRLDGIHSKTHLLGVDCAQTTLPFIPSRNHAVMVEVIVRNHNLKTSGYLAADDLKQRLHKQIKQQGDRHNTP